MRGACWSFHGIGLPPVECNNVTSAIKPEVHNASQRRRSRTEPSRQRGTWTEIGEDGRELRRNVCWQTDRRRHRQTRLSQYSAPIPGTSAASAVHRLPSAVRTATPAFHVRSSGLFCVRPGGLELVIAKFHYTGPTGPDPTRPGSPTKSADFFLVGSGAVPSMEFSYYRTACEIRHEFSPGPENFSVLVRSA